MNRPVRYATNKEGQSVAYQVTGDGPMCVVFIPDWVTNLEIMREEPTIDRFLNRLASFSRLVCFDKRGTGLSDPVSLGSLPTPEEWMHDVCTVLDDMGIESAALFGHGEGGAMAMLFTAAHPNRVHSLVLADTGAMRVRAPDYPAGIPRATAETMIRNLVNAWGTGQAAVNGAPSLAADPGMVARRARLERLAMSPAQFGAVYPCTYEHDLRPLLDTIQVPTLVVHRLDNPYFRIGNGRYLASHIKGAKMVELPGKDHFFHAGDSEALIGAIQEFLTGTREVPDHHRILATVLFTDIVGSTERAAQLGDQAWAELVDQHHTLVRQELGRFRGQEVDTAGDGFFATFDGPARAVRCALAIRDVLGRVGIPIRAGVHIGECELIGQKVGGIAVHIGARVMSTAQPGEIRVSRTVKDLVSGSGLSFEARGAHELKGVDGQWELFSAA